MMLSSAVVTRAAAAADCDVPERTNQHPIPDAIDQAYRANDPEQAYRIGKAELDRCQSSARGDECLDLMFETGSAADFAGLHAEAEVISREILRLSARLYGNESLQVALAASNLGVSLANQSRFEEARGFLHLALRIRRQICGELNLATARSYRNLANAVRPLGYQRDAFRYADASLKIELQLSDENSQSLAEAYRTMAFSLENAGDVPGALDLTRKALAIQLRADQPDLIEVAACYSGIGVYLTYLKRPEEGLEAHVKAFETLSPFLKDDHPLMMVKMANLAVAYSVVGRFAEAEAMADRVIAAHRRRPGVELEGVASAMGVKAQAYEKAGRFAQALALYREIVSMLAAANGDESTVLIASRGNLARATMRAGQYREALDQFRVLAIEANKELMWTAQRGTEGEVVEAVSDFRDVFKGQVQAAWHVSHGQ